MALPDFTPQFDEDFRVLAGFQQAEEAVAVAPLVPTPGRVLYRAWDGEPIGYSNDCDPLTAEPYLSGLLVPDILEENRWTMGEQWAMPAIAAATFYGRGAGPLQTTLWALAAFLAPFPVAAVMGLQALDLVPAMFEPITRVR